MIGDLITRGKRIGETASLKDDHGRCMLVMDNALIHTSKVFQDQIPKWEQQGLDIFYLPEFSPELNLIEILWRFMKYEWIEFWAYTSWNHLVTYVEEVIKTFGSKYLSHELSHAHR
jgi:transposase